MPSFVDAPGAAWRFLIANDIRTLPLDVDAVCRRNGWHLLSLDVADNMVIARILDKAGAYSNCDAFTCWYKNSVLIFYQASTHPERWRFAIAHEFGHITLRHFRGGAVWRHERDANAFAADILMPLCVLHECGVATAREISLMCGTSNTAARIRLSRLRQAERHDELCRRRDEITVARMFARFINTYRQGGRP